MFLNINDLWLFLLPIRFLLGAIDCNTLLITLCITVLQLFNVFFSLFLDSSLKIKRYIFLLPILILLMLFNKGALITLNIYLSIFLLKKIRLKELISVFLVSSVICFFIYVFIYSLGIMQDAIIVMPKGTAHTLGFSNSNVTSYFFTQMIIILIIFINKIDKTKLFQFVLFIPVYFVYKKTFGRTYYYMMILYYIFFVIFKQRFFYKRIKKMYVTIPFVFFIISISILFLYAQLPSAVNLFFSSRFSMNSLLIREFGLKNLIYGMVVPENVPMDSAYLGLLLNTGLISFFVFFIPCTKCFIKSPSGYIKEYFPFVFAMLIGGLFESMFCVYTVPTVLLYKIFIDGYRSECDEKKINNK